MNLLSICPQRVAVTAQRIMLGRYEPMVWRDSIDASGMETGTAETVGLGPKDDSPIGSEAGETLNRGNPR